MPIEIEELKKHNDSYDNIIEKYTDYKNIKENDGKITFGGLLWQTYNLFGVLLLGLVAGTWLSTGYYGQ